jgi:arsenate reductase (glutaredoxin)
VITFYGYDKCSTCRKAKKALVDRGVAFQFVDITVTPPPKRLLKQIVEGGAYKLSDLLNKSGVQYRELNMKERVKNMTPADLIDVLADNGRLCKRPIVSDGKQHTVGFDEAAFKKTWT